MNTKTMTLAALIACSLLPATAFADASRVEITRQVAYNDLDLASSAGRSHLDARIASAVRTICGTADPRELSQAADIRRCRHEAMAMSTRGRDLAVAESNRRTGVAMLTSTPTIGH